MYIKRMELVKSRLAKGMSQQDLGNQAGLSLTCIARVEQGGMPRASNIPKLAKVYGMTPEDFIELIYKV